MSIICECCSGSFGEDEGFSQLLMLGQGIFICKDCLSSYKAINYLKEEYYNPLEDYLEAV